MSATPDRPLDLGSLEDTGLFDAGADAAFERLARLMGGAQAPIGLIGTTAAGRLVVKGSFGIGPELLGAPIPLDLLPCGDVVATARPIVCDDLRVVPPWGDAPLVRALGIAAYASTPIVLGSGRTAGVVSVADREPRRWTPEALTLLADVAAVACCEIESREKALVLRALLQSMPDPVFVKDSDGRYRIANEAMARALRRPLSEILDHTDADLFPAAFAERIRKADSGIMASGAVESYEARSRRGPSRRTFLTTKGPYRNTSGDIAGVVGTSKDITEQTAALAALRALLDASPLAIVTLTADGRVLSWNPAAEALFGWREDEVMGQRLPCVAPERQEEYDQLRTRVLSGHPFHGLETQRIRADGRVLDVLISTAPVASVEGDPSLVAIYMDVTDRKRAEAELRQSQAQLRQAQKMEAVGQLAGGIAHDFNNLLTAILSYSDLLLSSLAPSSDLRGDVEEIRRAGARAADLTRQLLAFSRRQVLQLQPVQLNDVVTDVNRMLRRLLGEDIELQLRLAPDLPPTMADPGQLTQVLLNLAVNARDAMPEGGTLTIGTGHSVMPAGPATSDGPGGGAYITLTVRDTGHGMTRQVQERIFEPFFTTKPVGEGTGLGLSSVYGIVKQSEGYVSVESAPGEGASFVVYLPVARAATAGRSADPPATVPGAAETVLLVEDDAIVRRLTSEILKRNGYRVLEAPDGASAIRISDEYEAPIDLMITDVVMPRMSGRELVEQIRPRRPQTRLLYVSGYSEEAIARHGVLTDGVALLPKPYTPALLTAKLREILTRP